MRHAKKAIRNSSRDFAGFTITEVLVVVGVITLLLAVGVGYTRKGGQQIALFKEHAQLMQQILRARSFATQKLRPEDELICGYGISVISKSSFALFKDLPVGGACPGDGVMSGESELVDPPFVLDSAVRFFEWSRSDFVFSPRDGFVYFGRDRARPDQDPVRLTLQLEDSDQRLTVSVNYIGQVYTE